MGSNEKGLGKIAEHNVKIFDFEEPFIIQDLQIEAFKTSHDAADSAGFVISDGKSRLGIATDSGIITPEMRSALCGCDLVVLESNHDVSMLEAGSYPFYLKQRIKSDFGHLSNETAGDLALSTGAGRYPSTGALHLSQEKITIHCWPMKPPPGFLLVPVWYWMEM